MLIILLSINSYCKVVSVNLTHKIHTKSEPILIRGRVVNIANNSCFIKVLSETYGGDVLKLNQKCPNSLKKQDVIFGLFDGRNFMFLRNGR